MLFELRPPTTTTASTRSSKSSRAALAVFGGQADGVRERDVRVGIARPRRWYGRDQTRGGRRLTDDAEPLRRISHDLFGGFDDGELTWIKVADDPFDFDVAPTADHDHEATIATQALGRLVGTDDERTRGIHECFSRFDKACPLALPRRRGR